MEYISKYEKYLNFKKLYSYAKDRGNLEQYKNYIRKLKVLNEL